MMFHFSRFCSAALACALFLSASNLAGAAPRKGYLAQSSVQDFIDQMVSEHDFDRARLKKLFGHAKHRQAIIDAMKSPAEALPWYRYRNIFLTRKRTDGGIDFRQQHHKALARAQKLYGVPPSVITAIIGVESYYGRSQGDYRVIDALATLAFDYPPRADFFRGELVQYLFLSRQQHFDPAEVTGSYAGAMGVPQFISSSYRHYAVDFSGDGKSDLWHNWPDIIGSIGNYLAKNGWQRGGGVALPAKFDNNASGQAVQPMETTTASTLRDAGYQFDPALDGNTPARLLKLDASGTDAYWVVLHNFDVIMTYNHSPLYAMAVFQLSQSIANGSHAED